MDFNIGLFPDERALRYVDVVCLEISRYFAVIVIFINGLEAKNFIISADILI
jgi:hypothetical protein